MRMYSQILVCTDTLEGLRQVDVLGPRKNFNPLISRSVSNERRLVALTRGSKLSSPPRRHANTFVSVPQPSESATHRRTRHDQFSGDWCLLVLL